MSQFLMFAACALVSYLAGSARERLKITEEQHEMESENRRYVVSNAILRRALVNRANRGSFSRN